MQIRFVQLSVPVMELLSAGELIGAGRESGLALTGYFVSERGLRTWRRRAAQVSADPASGPWVQGAVISEPDGQIVGWSGFHGPPDAEGMVEVAYAVDPDFRRQGYAKAMLAGLLERASADAVIRTIRATISPDNAGSLATVRAFGFAQTGEQWDEEDGLELIFEISAR